jgi:hypothetical protein
VQGQTSHGSDSEKQLESSRAMIQVKNLLQCSAPSALLPVLYHQRYNTGALPSSSLIGATRQTISLGRGHRPLTCRFGPRIKLNGKTVPPDSRVSRRFDGPATVAAIKAQLGPCHSDTANPLVTHEQ